MLHLTKTPGKDFTVLNLSDPQLGNHEWDAENRNQKIFQKTMSELLAYKRPDFITITGDIAYGGHFDSYHHFAEYFDALGIPWTLVFGNHDNQDGPEAINKVVEDYMKHPLFIYEPGDPALGNGNFVILLEEEGKPVEGLVFMDTHDRMPYMNADGKETVEWARLYPEQVTWYREQIALVKKCGCEETMLFTHIPLAAYREAFAAASRPGVAPNAVDPHDSTGSRFWNPGYEDSEGVQYEGISSYPEDVGMFDAIVELGSTKNVICGHDHVNNWIIKYKGVRLMYAMKTGAGCYWNSVLNGGTFLTFTEKGLADVEHRFVDVSDLLG